MSSTSTTWTTDTNTKSGVVQVYSSNVSVLKVVADEGGSAILDLFADQGDDNADKWRMWVNASDDDLHFSNYTSGTAWTDMLTLQDGGNVGIGTASPDVLFDVESTVGSNPTVAVFGDTSHNTGLFVLSQATNMVIQAAAKNSYGTETKLAINPNGGNVGIGTTEPTVGLDVHHDAEISAGFGRADDGTNYISVRTGNTQDQLAGIAFMQGDATQTGVSSHYQLAGIAGKVINSTGHSTAEGELGFYVNSGDSIAQKMVLDKDGNVGIGETSPGATLDVAGTVAIGNGTELTISTGSITPTQSYHIVDTEGDASSDDLTTISGSVVGVILVIRPAHTDRTVVVKDGTGNIKCVGDFSMDSNEDMMTLICTGSNWHEIARSSNA